MKNKWVAFVLFIVFVVIFWNILDAAYHLIITRSGLSFSAGFDLALPVVIGAAMGFLLYLRDK